MKNLKPAWKLYFTMIKQNRIIWVAFLMLAMSIALMALIGIEGEPIGNGEHLLSVSMTTFGYYMAFMGTMFLYASFINNRFFVSCPEAKTVFTRILPLAAMAMNILLTAISTIFVIANGHSLQTFSDVLIFNALGIMISQISICLVSVNYGFVLSYVCLIPWCGLIFTTDNPPTEFLKNLHLYGFNVPVEISAIICVVTAVITFIVSFRLSDAIYKKRSVRLMNAAASFVTAK